MIDVGGNFTDITDDTIEDIHLDYAITIHKLQGSQWPKWMLNLPSYASRMTGRLLLYTAVTRPSSELMMKGNSSLIQSAINMGNCSLKRIPNIIELKYNTIGNAVEAFDSPTAIIETFIGFQK